jgi:hypothetical protein
MLPDSSPDNQDDYKHCQRVCGQALILPVIATTGPLPTGQETSSGATNSVTGCEFSTGYATSRYTDIAGVSTRTQTL